MINTHPLYLLPLFFHSFFKSLKRPWVIFTLLLFNPLAVNANIPPQELDTNHLLSETIRSNLTGLSFEPLATKESLHDDAHWYVRQRADWKFHGSRDRILRGCRHDAKRKTFCTVLSEMDKHEKLSDHPRSLFAFLKSIHSRIEINSWIKNANTEKLSAAPSHEIRMALRKIDSAASLKSLISRSLGSPSCKNAFLNQALGCKMEEFLPDTENRKTVIQLYEKAISCGNSESSNRARYRLSLMYIWNDQCKMALPHLAYLASVNDTTDYQPRALFWQIHCLETSAQEKIANAKTNPNSQTKSLLSSAPNTTPKFKKDPLIEQTKQALIEKYPFSFHTLLVQKTDSNEKLPISLESDSDLQFRSETHPIVNEKIKAIEALLDIKETRLAKEILDSLGHDLDTTEPELRLYVGVLYSRLNYFLKNFQLLSGVFRDDPTLISKTSLELYYPKSPLRFSDLNQSQIDDKLLLSLIRQESGFNANARSPVGARGLMQIMPGTARRFERIKRYDQLFDPSFNLKVGSRYFAGLLEKYNGDAELALAAYNAGPKRVDQWLVNYPVKDRILFLDLIPFRETRDYVASIARNYYWYVSLYPKPHTLAANQPPVPSSGQKTPGELFRYLTTPSLKQIGRTE